MVKQKIKNDIKMKRIKDRLKGMGLTLSTVKTYTCHLNLFFKYLRKIDNIAAIEKYNTISCVIP